MAELKRISIFVLHNEDSRDFDWVHAWVLKWKRTDQLRVADYSTGGWEHCWDVETVPEAIAEVPEEFLCASEWASPELFKP
jgi:hypothetical protein